MKNKWNILFCLTLLVACVALSGCTASNTEEGSNTNTETDADVNTTNVTDKETEGDTTDLYLEDEAVYEEEIEDNSDEEVEEEIIYDDSEDASTPIEPEEPTDEELE